jgi:hypothetical protein
MRRKRKRRKRNRGKVMMIDIRRRGKRKGTGSIVPFDTSLGRKHNAFVCFTEVQYMCAGNLRSSGLMKMTSSCSRRIIMADLYAPFKKIFTCGDVA